tara:strand:- start:3229 stop:3420 length:192 start_codon:yes stop_codon:yes gene_type:complete
MCLGKQARVAGILPSAYRNRPVTVTGQQTGVANPKDTAAATESLRLQRQRKTLEAIMNKGGLG